ncbi:MAG: glycosyltransferase [Opitutales bacterium]|nr:glycosyltransferase [Opitutales bacterium]
MKTLLQISTVVGYGSTGKIAEEIGKTALAAGWRSVIAYGRTMGKKNIRSASELIRIGSDFDNYCHWALDKFLDLEGFGSYFATKRLIRQIRAIRPDIIQLHNLHDHYLNLPVLFDYLRACDVPVFWTQHDCWMLSGGCMYFVADRCEQWHNGEQCRNCPQIRRLQWNNRHRNLLWRRDFINPVPKLTFVPVSDWLAELTRQSIYAAHPVRRIYNGIDTDIFIPEPHPQPAQNKTPFKILGCANVWEERKGLNDFFKLRERFSKNDLQITLVGLTAAQIAQLPDGIRGIGRTQNLQELIELYRDADLFVNPTYQDNFPTVNIEALACGTPVVTYSGTGGSAEAVTPETGFVVPAGDIDGICRAIETVRSRGKSSYSAACRSRAVKHFKAADRFNEYLKLYNEALETQTRE